MRRLITISVLAAILAAAVAVAWGVGRRLSAWRHGPVVERPLTGPTIIVDKAERILRLYSAGRLAATYRIGLGFQPVGHKQREGDGRTPEGRYTVCVKNPNSRFYLSLGLSYPNKSDADRGLSAGLISAAQHEAVSRAIDAGGPPPWDTPLGGEVFIHGRGSSGDWTRGCIALDDADMKELYEQTPVGTVVDIRP